MAHQNITVSFREFSERLHDLFLCPSLLEIPVHRAIFFLERKKQRKPVIKLRATAQKKRFMNAALQLTKPDVK